MCEEGQCEWSDVGVESKGGEVSAVMAARSRAFLHVIHRAIGVTGETIGRVESCHVLTTK